MEESPSASGSTDAPRLSPDAIPSQQFPRAADGLVEAAVREFLREVAARIRVLEARIEELEQELTTSATAPADDPRADELFARLRKADEEPAPKPAKAPKPPEQAQPEPPKPPAEPPVAAPSLEEPEPEAAAAPPSEPAPAPPPSKEDAYRQERDELIDNLAEDLGRSAKRLLQDEQNLLLDAARRARKRVDPDRIVPAADNNRDAWTGLLRPAIDRAYGGGRGVVIRTRKPSTAPDRLVHDLATDLVVPLRDRLRATVATVLAEGPYDSRAELHRELSSAIGARYREWRNSELATRLVDSLAIAYARGAYDAAPSGARLQWITDAAQRCPDCDDNALEPTVKGQSFPTGQTHPPAHPGCRCIVVPVDPTGQ